MNLSNIESIELEIFDVAIKIEKISRGTSNASFRDVVLEQFVVDPRNSTAMKGFVFIRDPELARGTG